MISMIKKQSYKQDKIPISNANIALLSKINTYIYISYIQIYFNYIFQKIYIYIYFKINQFHFYQTQTSSYLKNNKSTSFCSNK